MLVSHDSEMWTKSRSKYVYTDKAITGWHKPTQEDIKDIKTGCSSCNLVVITCI